MKGGGNAWTDHIHDFAKRNNMTYMCALSNAKCKEEYHSKKPKKVKKGRLAEKEQMGMEDIDAPVDKKKQVKFKKAVLAKKLEKETEKKENEQMGMEDVNVVLLNPKKNVEVAKKSRGRPKKYQTKEEADKAKHDNTVKAFKRRQEEKRQAKKEAKENKMMAQEDKPKKRGRPKKTGAGSGVSTARRPTTPVAELAPVVAENVMVRPNTAEMAEMPRAVANVQGVESPRLANARYHIEQAQSVLAELIRLGHITPQRRADMEANIAQAYNTLNEQSREGRGTGKPRGRPRKAKKGGAVADWENSIKKIGNSLGKPFEAVTYLNPFDLGYSLGHDVLGPALFGSGADPAREGGEPEDDPALISHREMAEGADEREQAVAIRLYQQAQRINSRLRFLIDKKRELEESIRLFRDDPRIVSLNLPEPDGRMGDLSTFQEELAIVNNEIPNIIEDITAVFQELHRRGIPVPVLQGNGRGFPANINASFSNASRLGYPAKLSSSFSHSGRMIGGMTDTEATVLALGSVGGLYVLNELYKFAYQRIMGRQRVPIQVAQAIARHPVPRGIPQAIARVVQQELVPAHYAVYPHEHSVPLSAVEVRDVETGRGMSGGMTRAQIHTNLMSNGWYRDLPDDVKLVVWRTVENVVKDLDGDVRSVGGINKLVESVRKVLNIPVPSVSQSPFENEEEEPDEDFLKEMEGEGQSKSKVAPAGKTKKVAPAPSSSSSSSSEDEGYVPRISPAMIQRQEQRRMVMNDPQVIQHDAQMSELRKMLEGLAPKKPEGKGRKGGLKLTKKSVLEHYGNIVNHLVSHITDPKEPIDKRDYSQSIDVIKEIKKIKGKK
jgi:hypothetical protein